MWNASVILLQVGFRDDTSYLAAHYGGGRTPRSIAQTAAASEASTLRDARNLYQQQDKCRISSTTLGVSRPSPNAISSSSAPRCGRIPTPPSGLADRNRHSSRSSSSSGGGGADRRGANNAAVEGSGVTSIRPTLSEQLASIGKAAEDITA